MRAALLTLLVLFGSHRVLSCVCTWPAEFSNYELSFDILHSTPAIVRAVVTDTVNPANTWNGESQRVRLRTLEAYKGQLDSTFVVSNPMWGSSCDPTYGVGREYLLFLEPDTTGMFRLAFCSGLFEVNTEDSTWWGIARKSILQQLSTYKANHTQPLRVRYSNGQALAKGRLVNGRPEGHWKLFTYDGQVEYEGTFENGKREGVWKKYVEPRLDEGHWGPGMEPRLTKQMTAHFEHGIQMNYWTYQGQPLIPIEK